MKLCMSTIVAALVLIAVGIGSPAFAQQGNVPEGTGCLVADILILADASDSLHGAESFVWDAVGVLPNRFQMHESNVRMGLIRFRETPTLVTPLTGNRALFLTNLAETRKIGANGNTDILKALTLAKKQFDDSPRPGVPKFVILITDGLSKNTRSVEVDYATSIKENGVTILGIHTPIVLPWDPSSDDEEIHEKEEIESYVKSEQRKRQFQESKKCWEKGGKHLENLATQDLYFEVEYESLVELFRELTICS